MKKILSVLLLIASMCGISHALEDMWTSSNTATADTSQPLCTQFLIGTSTYTMRSVVHEVVVSSASAGTFQVWNSSWNTTGTQTLGPIMTSSLGSYFFDVAFPQGLLYTKTGGGQVQIMYACYQ
jgi:hypothetical protein